MADGRHPQDPPSEAEESPEGIEITIPSDDALRQTTSIVPETVTEEGEESLYGLTQQLREQQRLLQIQQQQVAMMEGVATDDTAGMDDSYPFRAQFDDMMSLLGKRFENERRNLEGKHAQELEDALNMLSFTSSERDTKRQEMQVALLEDIGDMAQQLHDLTGMLGSVPEGSEYDAMAAAAAVGANLEGGVGGFLPQQEPTTTIRQPPPSSGRAVVPEEYLQQMNRLEEQFQLEKLEMERKHAMEMEEALGALKLSREQRESHQRVLQDQLLDEIKEMAKQLEQLNKAKEAYESKMDTLRKRLHEKEMGGGTTSSKRQDLQSMETKLRHVQREAQAAQDELRRLQVSEKKFVESLLYPLSRYNSNDFYCHLFH